MCFLTPVQGVPRLVGQKKPWPRRGSLSLRSSTVTRTSWVCVAGPEAQGCDQLLCLLWPYGQINMDKSACRLQYLVGLTPYSKAVPSGFFCSSCTFVPCHRRHTVIPILVHLQSFPMPQERNIWEGFQSDPPPPR